MLQKVIQVGNSVAVTIPKAFAKQMGWHAGKEVVVEQDAETQTLVVHPQKKRDIQRGELTPEFMEWLTAFNKKYKHVLTELAKK